MPLSRSQALLEHTEHNAQRVTSHLGWVNLHGLGTVSCMTLSMGEAWSATDHPSGL